MTSARSIIVSAANEGYFSLAQELFQSIRAHKFAVSFDLGILDIGLSEANREWLRQNNIQIATAGRDIEFPGRENWEKTKPGFYTLTARLFMRAYFPGYDTYMWMDADIWVQTPEAINTMIGAAQKTDAIQIACELDRCYRTFYEHAGVWHIFRDWYKINYGEKIADAMTLKPMLNAGVWAMSKNSPVWQAWIDIYSEALQKLPEANDKSFMADQLGLNILVYMKRLPHMPMPASYNWMTFYALPMLDNATGMYVEPLPPYRPISHIHLTRQIKTQAEKIQCLDGSVVERALTYSASGK